MAKTFDIRSYDLFSFDLDNTICEYNIKNFYTSQYQYFTNYLVKTKHYKQLNTELTPEDVSFISRGLFIDYEKGNLLKLNKDGVILRASHGTKMLSEESISNIYGTNRDWELIKGILTDPVQIISSKFLKKILPIMDFMHAPLSIVYAKAVDSAKDSGKTIAHVQYDLSDAINSLSKPNNSWTTLFMSNLDSYTYKQDECLVNWLKKLKSFSNTSLITSSDGLVAQLVAARALGNNWKELFDFVIYSSRKPHFFTESQHFYSFSKRKKPIQFNFKGEYTRGSFNQVEISLSEKLGRKPKTIYFGDNPINDLVSAPEAVAIIEESGQDNSIEFMKNNNDFLKSKEWGSPLYENKVPTWFGDIAINATFCSPSLNYFSRSPNQYVFTQFNPYK